MSERSRKPETAEERAKKTKELSESYRENVFFPYSGKGILNLVDEQRWPNLLVADEQKEILTRMHRLVRETQKVFNDSTADYLETNPHDYEHYIEVCGKRLSASTVDARRLVKFGLLTQEQTDYYLHRTYSQDLTSPLTIISQPSAHELFKITPEQYRQYEKAEREANIKQSHLNLMSGDSTATKKLRQINEERERTVATLFTTEQHRIWAQLRAKRPKPAVPKKLTTPDSLVDLTTISDLFEKISAVDSKIDLSSRQRKILKEFEAVIQLGLHWIKRRSHGPFPAGDARNCNANPVTQTQKLFMHHVDRFALLGILSVHQAEKANPTIHNEMRQ